MIVYLLINGHAIRKHSLYQKSVGLFWKGLYVGRGLANSTTQTKTTYQMTTRAKAVEMTNRWNEVLTQEQRDMWTQYAGSLGSAVDREKSDNVAKTKNVIPKRSKLMSGLNAYIKSNIVEYLADGGGPDDIAPIGDQTPPPPLNV